jgi:hypothetical protein
VKAERGGAIAAFVVGALTFGAGTLGTALLLLAFFISSTLLSRAGKARKRELVDIGKGGPRDAAQVLANGGAATVCALAWVLVDHGNGSSFWFLAFAGAYAAATADTWGTEIGTLAAEPPRSIVSRKPIATGLSGGVTPAGTSAEIAGAVLIAVLTRPGLRGRLRRRVDRLAARRDAARPPLVPRLRPRVRDEPPRLRHRHRTPSRPALDEQRRREFRRNALGRDHRRARRPRAPPRPRRLAMRAPRVIPSEGSRQRTAVEGQRPARHVAKGTSIAVPRLRACCAALGMT